MASLPRQVQHPRRLFELLEEQQEPFLLDVYLLENGYSDRALRSQATVLCWPGSACRSLLRLSSHGCKRKRGGVLRCILNNFLHRKVIWKALSWEGTARENGRRGVFEMGTESHVADFHRLSSSSAVNEGELDGEVQWKVLEDSNQPSPVSVLELHSDEASPVRNHSPSSNLTKETEEASWVGLEELLGSASLLSQHAKTKTESNESHQLLLDCVRELEEGIWGSHECLSPERPKRTIKEHIFSWEKLRGDLADITQLVDLEVSKCREEWRHFQPEIREIGIEIEAVIFEEIGEEIALDMLDFQCTSKRL
ncbi:uncharacterized protein LOC103713681 [Phoenix dactylifera]|uniref:Uncharacterized protein LOC103713681 n=1 Tax=Phoenix dactylifera TaxID=42345 RepID=A0A8B7CGZ5_PHODC|nr:uncharacterized protein LOC103713681 [Phoenix dactylifera]XP_008798917.2 uncharacterized protein LOC103713681 [Phoenix dactylifera]